LLTLSGLAKGKKMSLQFIIIGNGHLSEYITNNLIAIGKTSGLNIASIINWNSFDKKYLPGQIVVHVGSGRQLAEAIMYCQMNMTPLIQASTGIQYDSQLPVDLRFTLLETPNLSIPIIKMLYMLKKNGHLFKDYQIKMTESHQARKTSLPGTAKAIADALSYPIDKIESIRNVLFQNTELKVPENYLDSHAIHQIEITEGNCKIEIMSKVLGFDSYLYGLSAITKVIGKLENRKYYITDLIDGGIL
jgi:4-hydroxy-tetrahydrodipicolinate reductase